MGRYMQYQTAQSIPKFAEGAGQGGSSGVVGDAVGLGAGVALGQVMARHSSEGTGPARRRPPQRRRRV